MKLNLPDTVSSPQDLAVIIVDVQAYARWFMHESIKKQAGTAHASEQPTIAPEAMAVINDWESNQPLSIERLESLIRVLTDYKVTAPSITLTLAAPPTRPVKSALVAWCRQNIAPNILVTFQFNSTLLGGMVVRSGSHVFDWSFRRQILQSRSKFPEVLRRV